MKKKKIFWLTADNFFDVDIPLIPLLAAEFDIEWCIHVRKNAHYFTERNIAQYIPNRCNLKVKVVKSECRLSSLKTLKLFIGMGHTIKKNHYDIAYINMSGIPYLFFVLGSMRIKNLIYACHDFVVHKNMLHARWYKIYREYAFLTFSHFQLFSRTQYRLFKARFPYKNAFFASLCLKDFGSSQCNKPEDVVVFTFFGTIRKNKGLQYLIEAGNLLAERHISQKFLIRICGFHEKWEEEYQACIHHPEVFEMDIRKIPNEEIANIFSTSHFLILPYIDVTQSGPMMIAYNYTLPVIASNHDGFKEYVDDGVTGYLFEDRNSISLAEKMLFAIENHGKYDILRENLRSYINKNLSTSSIVRKYSDFFNSI